MKQPRLVGYAGLLLVLLAACIPVGYPRGPSFTLSLNPPILRAHQGGSTTIVLTLIPEGGFRGTVFLSLADAPRGFSLSPTSVQVTGTGPVVQRLTLSVAPEVTPGTYVLTLQGISSSFLQEVDFRLTVISSEVIPSEDPPLPGAGEVWRRVNAFLRSIAYGDGRWVAVGGWGTVLTSTDGVSWQAIESGTINKLRGVAYGNGRWVAVGSGGTILISTDGLSWRIARSGTENELNSVAYGGGLWVAVGENGILLTSVDGLSWRAGLSGTKSRLYGAAYGGGRWIVVGGDGAGGTILTSVDGLFWQTVMSGARNWLLGVAYHNERWVAVGGGGTILTSTDGFSWRAIESRTGSWLYGIAYGGGLWVAVGDYDTLLTSTDSKLAPPAYPA